MNSLNDLIQSHNMYDATSHIQPLEVPPEPEYQEIKQPEFRQAPTQPTYSESSPQYVPRQEYYAPPQMPMRDVAPQYVQPERHLPTYQYPAPREHQVYQVEQERHTISTMMRDIASMQRRLSGMMSSLEAMIERTDIMHEYHHIARYSSERGMAAQQRVSYQEPIAEPRYTQYAQQPTQHRQVVEHPYQLQPTHQPPTPQQGTGHMNQPQQFDPQQAVEEPMSIKEGVFDGANMISAEGDMYAIPVSFLCDQKLIEGDIMQAMVFASGQIQYKLSEPIAREHIMGILSTHSGTSPYYIVQTANKAYNVLKEAVESAGATPGKQILLTVPAGGESEWAAIEKIFT